MEKLKQRVCDAVSYKNNIGVLQTKLQVLVEEVAEVEGLLISEENDSRGEVQQWLGEAHEILRETRCNLERRNDLAHKKLLLCSTCSWKTGETLRGIDKILEERKGLDLSSYFCGLSYCKKLHLRENKSQEILEAVMDISINMIGIYGMIGVGKTVLAEELARWADDNQLFDDIVMVQVSESLDIKHTQTQIASKIGLQLSGVDDGGTRAHILYNALEEKMMMRGEENDTKPGQQRKILVILDGIQRMIDLGKVGVPYGQEGRASCKVVLISRNADVCKMMGAEKQFLVECLNLDEAKILFQEKLGDKIESMEEVTLERYQYMENVFLIKCRGLPMVICSLACALRSMSWSNWETVVDQMERHPLVEVDEVKQVLHAILELCNSFIQNGGKHKLFLLCCLLQQGMDLTLASLMRYVIGLGLFEDESIASIMDQITLWVDELKSLSLLLDRGEPKHVTMHAIVQDVVISALSQGDYVLHVLLCVGTCWHTRESYEKSIAISMMPGSNCKVLNGLELHKLEAFLLKGKPSLSPPSHFFQRMQNLKILDISGITFVEFPSSIGDLKNLVTLNLENCDIKCGFLSTLSNLARLEVLSLRESSVETIPEEIGDLTNLRVLDLTRCKNIRTFCVDAVAKLDQLRGLYLYDICWHWSTDDMKKLKSLHLEVLEIVIPEACQMSVNVLNLRNFVISCRGRFPQLQEKDFCSFSRVLLINDGASLHLEESGLSYLLPWTEFLQIKEVSCLWSGVGDMSTHGFLHLRNMYVDMCGSMKCILDASKLSLIQRDIFPELEILTLTQLSNLTSICCWQARHSFFPKLRELRLRDLNKLHPYVLPLQLVIKLRVMEISQCGKLLYIFPASEVNETHAADSSVEFSCMKKLELKGLKSLLALQDVLEASLTKYELDRPHYLLFSEKIKFPSLKEMHLEGLDQIGNLWDFSGSKERDVELLHLQSRTWGKQPYGKSHCFGNLKCMTVFYCNKLESLFPSSIINSLLQLETLRVNGCDNMKEVITSTEVEDDNNPTSMITFPKLHTLELRLIRSLRCFYSGHLLLKLPKLRELDLHDLGEMKAFTLPNTQSLQTEDTILFDGEIDFPSLEHIGVSGMSVDLLQRPSDTTKFPNLSRLTLKGLENLESLPNMNTKTLRFLDLNDIACFKLLFSIQPAYMTSMLPILSWELEELILSESDFLEALVDDENLINNGNLFVSLRKLQLCRLHQLKRIPWNMLRNLRSLIIYTLGGWTSLISTTLVGGDVLPLLEYFEVGMCNSLEAIIPQELRENEDFVKYGMTLFPCLRRIEFYWLPKLQSFSLESYEVHFPLLEAVVIWECYSLQSFSMGPLRTLRLKYVKLDSETTEADTSIDLNVVVAGMNTTKLCVLDVAY